MLRRFTKYKRECLHAQIDYRNLGKCKFMKLNFEVFYDVRVLQIIFGKIPRKLNVIDEGCL